MIGDVTVALSSMVRLRSFASYPFLIYASLYMLDAMIMLKYWSHMIRLRKMPTNAVLPTIVIGRFGQRSMLYTILSSIFDDDIAAPKIIAQTISQTVLVIPAIPLVETSEFRVSLPVSIFVSQYIIVSNPITVALIVRAFKPDIS